MSHFFCLETWKKFSCLWFTHFTTICSGSAVLFCFVFFFLPNLLGLYYLFSNYKIRAAFILRSFLFSSVKVLPLTHHLHLSLLKTYYWYFKSLDPSMSFLHFFHLYIFALFFDWFLLLGISCYWCRSQQTLFFSLIFLLLFCLFVCLSGNHACLLQFQKIFSVGLQLSHQGSWGTLFLWLPNCSVWSFSKWWHHTAVFLPFLLLLDPLGSVLMYHMGWQPTKRKTKHLYLWEPEGAEERARRKHSIVSPTLLSLPSTSLVQLLSILFTSWGQWEQV